MKSYPFAQVELILFGIMLWEVAVTFPFDFNAFASRKVRWPTAVYFATKYSALAFATSIFMFNDVRRYAC